MLVELYADASWSIVQDVGVISFYETYTNEFYVSNKFKCDSSKSAECVAVDLALQALLVKIHKNNLPVTSIIIYTDLLDIVNKFNNYSNCTDLTANCILRNLFSNISIFSDEINIEIKFTNRKKSNIFQLVDMLAYRKLKDIPLEIEKKFVFGMYADTNVNSYSVKWYDE